MKNISALISGVLFGTGLALSGMTDTSKVIGFLDILGNWDPDLVFVMGSAVITTTLGFKILFGQKQKPLFNSNFSLPIKNTIDTKLILGAALFGIGWGTYGYCPGPAIASLVYLSTTTLVFVATLIVGMAIGAAFSSRVKI